MDYSNGNTLLTISGGTPGYSQDWGTNNPNTLSGTYYYTISDTNGCTFNDSVTITEPNELKYKFNNNKCSL